MAEKYIIKQEEEPTFFKQRNVNEQEIVVTKENKCKVKGSDKQALSAGWFRMVFSIRSREQDLVLKLTI